MKKPFRHPTVPHTPGVAALAAATLFTLALVPGCKGLEIASAWPPTEVKIDGINSEWNGHTTAVEDAHLVAGVFNDSDFIYITLMTAERGAKHQLMRGLKIWFDPTQGKKKRFGVRFPVLSLENSPGAGGQGGETEAEGGHEELESFMNELEVLGPGDNAMRLPLDDARSIEARMGRKNGALIYELKVPLQKRSRSTIGIGAVPGRTIHVGLESPQFEMKRPFRGGMHGSPVGRSGDVPPAGGRSGVRDPTTGGPSGKGTLFDRPEPIDVWVKVHLAPEGDA